MHPALLACLHPSPPAPPAADLAAWLPRWQTLQALPSAPGTGDPAGLAIAGGFASDRVGWAFACGYQAALRALVPSLPRGALGAFCVTEADGNRPRDVHTRLQPQADGTLRLDGSKRWAMLGSAASVLLVVGRLAEAGAAPADGSDTARPVLRVALVPVPSPGLTVTALPATRFVPEVPHATLQLQGVPVPAGALLPGDGHEAHVKPFRTLEDVHVNLAIGAYLLREAQARGWPAPFREQLVASLVLLAALAAADPRAATTHVALAGALHGLQRLWAEAQPLWATAGSDPAAARWQRDAALFTVAGTARQLRTQRAWERLGAAAMPPVV